MTDKALSSLTQGSLDTGDYFYGAPGGNSRKIQAGTMPFSPSKSPAFTNLTQTGYHDLTEISEPSSPGANVMRVYSVDNGNGKTLGKVKDSSGNAAFLGGPEILHADRTYYVRTDGSDSNTGLADSAGGAFLTLQAAVDAAYELDLNGFAVTIDVGNGTYTSGVDCVGQMRGIKAGVTPLTITGDTSTPTNVIINTTDDNCFKAELGASVTVQGFQVAATISAGDVVSAACLAAFSGGQITHGNMDFDETDGHHKHASEGGRITTTTDHTISGGTGGRHIHAANRGYQSVKNCTVTLTGTPDFATGFLATAAADTEFINCTFSGSATGQRFFLHYGSTLRTDQAASTIDTYFPGDSDGLAIGSKYDNLDSTIRLRNGGSIVFDVADENIVILHSDTNDILLFNGASGGYRFDNSIKSSSSSGGIGYVAGAGGAVTQATSKSTAVTLNAICGRITMDSAALADGALVSFTCNNSSAAFGDTVVVNHLTTGTPGGYSINARSLSGSIQFNVRNISGGSLSEAIILVFSIIKAVNA